MRRGVLAVVASALGVGLALLAEPNGASKQPGTGSGNYLDHLAIAKSNVLAARDNLQAKKTMQPPLIQQDTAKLDEVIANLDKSSAGFATDYKKKPATLPKPNGEIPATLSGQLAKAGTELEAARNILDGFPARERAGNSPTTIEDPLQQAIDGLAEVQQTIPSERPGDSTNTTQNAAASGSAAHLPSTPDPLSSSNSDPANQDRSHRVGLRLKDAASGAPWQLLLSLLAVLLSGLAILLGFLPVGPFKQLRSKQRELDARLKSLEEKSSGFNGTIKDLKEQASELGTQVGRAVQAANAAAELTQPTWTGQERRKSGTIEKSAPPTDEPETAGWSARGEMDDLRVPARQAASREDERPAAMDEPSTPPPTVTLPKPREPVADYNAVRAMKASDRATEFAQLYPKQIIMTCSNPSARNSGPFTELRFKEDQYGKFQAVEHGKETLLFPELNYDYGTGRKTLEGVFLYPEVESANLRLSRPAVLEKRNEEWALIQQGVLGNG